MSAFSQTLRRYTSLNHLAQAARAVMNDSSLTSQMLVDLNRVDFANVQVKHSHKIALQPLLSLPRHRTYFREFLKENVRHLTGLLAQLFAGHLGLDSRADQIGTLSPQRLQLAASFLGAVLPWREAAEMRPAGHHSLLASA